VEEGFGVSHYLQAQEHTPIRGHFGYLKHAPPTCEVGALDLDATELRVGGEGHQPTHPGAGSGSCLGHSARPMRFTPTAAWGTLPRPSPACWSPAPP
jgi:hypothetical protein